MTYHRVGNYITTTGDTSGAGTVYPSGPPESPPPVFSGVRATHSILGNGNIDDIEVHTHTDWVNISIYHSREEFEETKREISIRISKKNRLDNGRKKKRGGGFCSSSKIGRNDIADNV
jgi:hypothetical protein